MAKKLSEELQEAFPNNQFPEDFLIERENGDDNSQNPFLSPLDFYNQTTQGLDTAEQKKKTQTPHHQSPSEGLGIESDTDSTTGLGIDDSDIDNANPQTDSESETADDAKSTTRTKKRNVANRPRPLPRRSSMKGKPFQKNNATTPAQVPGFFSNTTPNNLLTDSETEEDALPRTLDTTNKKN